MNLRRRYLALFITTGTIFLAGFVLSFIFELNGTLKENPAFAILLIILVPAIISAAMFFFMRFTQETQKKINLENENLYALGKKTTFFNLASFEVRVALLKKSFLNRKKKQYITIFSAANQSVMENTSHDESIISFSAKIADFLTSYFDKDKGLLHRDSAFAYNKGLFYVYTVSDEDDHIKNLVNAISNDLFKIAEDEDLHVWVQPFFGVTEVNYESPLIEDIENASIARDVSERNFESLTFYHESFRKHSSKSEIDEITKALTNNEFVVYYQPKFSLTAKRFVSSEALVRWNSPTHGLLEPSKFIFIAENAGLIHSIDTYVFNRVCEDLNEAKRKGRRVLPVSINFSLHEFYSMNFLDSVISTIEKHDINPSLIEIEITESTSQTNTFMASSVIRKLRDHGIRVLMDDFGVGFSNIGNLRKMPFDAVKIDKSFIDNIESDKKASAIVKFLIELCQANELEVIAEGVDNKEQVEILKKAKCDTIQGFYYSRPIPKAEYEKFLISNPFERKDGKR